MMGIKMACVKRFYDTFLMSIIGFVGGTLQIVDGHLFKGSMLQIFMVGIK